MTLFFIFISMYCVSHLNQQVLITSLNPWNRSIVVATGQKCKPHYPSISAYSSSLRSLTDKPTICFKLDTRRTIHYHSYYEKDNSFTNCRSFFDAEDLFIHTSQGLLLRRRLCAHCKCDVVNRLNDLILKTLNRVNLLWKFLRHRWNGAKVPETRSNV